jgi:hypothetical protein
MDISSPAVCAAVHSFLFTGASRQRGTQAHPWTYSVMFLAIPTRGHGRHKVLVNGPISHARHQPAEQLWGSSLPRRPRAFLLASPTISRLRANGDESVGNQASPVFEPVPGASRCLKVGSSANIRDCPACQILVDIDQIVTQFLLRFSLSPIIRILIEIAEPGRPVPPVNILLCLHN